MDRVKEMTLSPNAGRINDNLCHILRNERGDHTDSYWVDPSAEYSIRQIEHAFKGKPHLRQNYEYERHEEFGCVLTGWERAESSETSAYDITVKAKVIDSKLNARASEAEFVLNFPPGTLIQNVIDPEKPAYQIVRPDGTKRDVSQKELAESTPKEIFER